MSLLQYCSLYCVGDFSFCRVISTSSTQKSNGVTSPRDPVQEQLAVEQDHSTHNGVMSADPSISRPDLKRKHLWENRIEAYIHTLSYVDLTV